MAPNFAAMEPVARIRLSPPDDDRPLPAPAPMGYAQRWNSDYDTGELQPLVPVFMTQPSYARIYVHAASDLDNEVGGVLVGQWYLDPEVETQFLVVENILPARYTRQSSVHLTFTQDSLVDFHEVIEKRFTGKRIVGWYHTHPRMGVFLSHYDTWLHNNFFPEPWQVALVVEPHTSIGGFFIRQAGGVLDPARYFGFYEMNGRLGRSTVRWQNLTRPGEEKE